MIFHYIGIQKTIFVGNGLLAIISRSGILFDIISILKSFIFILILKSFDIIFSENIAFIIL